MHPFKDKLLIRIELEAYKNTIIVPGQEYRQKQQRNLPKIKISLWEVKMGDLK